MAQQEPAVVDKALDFMFGKEEGDDYQPDPKPVLEGEEADPEEEVASEEPDSTPEDSIELAEYELNGALYDVPPDIKAELEKARDYTQKTQKVASERKELEILRGQLESAHKQQEFVKSIQEEATQVQTLEWQIGQANQYLRENFDSLEDKEILKLRQQIDMAKEQRDGLTSKLSNKYQEFQQAQEQTHKELLDKSTAILRSKYKDWSTVEKEVEDYALSLGFTEDQVKIAKYDPKQIELVRKAQLYDRLQETKTAAVTKAKTAPPLKPKSRNPMPKEVGDKLNLRKKLKSQKASSQEKANALGGFLADRFNM